MIIARPGLFVSQESEENVWQWLDDEMVWFPFWYEGQRWYHVPVWLGSAEVWALERRLYPRKATQLPLFLLGVL